ncbi:MAG: thiamine pyrophosphate-binding protein [Chloroflexi bacterium]|nr:thiamine pyrophosphate-binding protein [Chloroflexota bacterium]
MALARDVIFDYLHDLGVAYMFGVPGTNEIPIIDGTSDPKHGIAYIPCLHENIALGAAAGYAHMTGKPGVVTLHVTPGAGHGLGNLFNAFKSHLPVVVLCGQQASHLNLQEPLLYSDLVQVARPYTKWAYEVRSAAEFPLVFQRAFKEALAPPTGPVFVAIPWDFTLEEVPYRGRGSVTRIAPRFTGDAGAVREAAGHLAAAGHPVIIVGDGVGYADAWGEIRELADLLKAPVYSETLSSLMNYPNNLPHWQGELPGAQELFQQVFTTWDCDVAFLCGYNAQAQIVVFDYAKGPLIPDSVTQLYLHNDPWQIGKNGYGDVAILGDIKATLPLLSRTIREHPDFSPEAAAARDADLKELARKRDELLASHLAEVNQVSRGTGEEGQGTDCITGEQVARALANLQGEMARPLVYVHEAISDGSFFQQYLRFDAPTSYYCAQGGSLGYSMPASLGIALAVGDERTVVNAVGDGSSLFYPQVWYTAAQHNLKVLYIITNNREYKTLLVGLQQIEALFNWKPTGDPWYLYLREPAPDIVNIAAGFGVRGEQVSRYSELEPALRRGLRAAQSGPYVLDVLIDPSLSPPLAANTGDPRLDNRFALQEFVP